MRILTLLFLTAFFSLNAMAQGWHKMSETELRSAIPEKAPVIKENIETEFRTASGIISGKTTIFGVVIITAGYEADGKYTHFLRTGTDLRVGNLDLPPGDYIFGYRRIDAETLGVTFYQAKTGKAIGATNARLEQKKGAIYAFLIAPPAERSGKIYIGRFAFDYSIK